MDSKYPWSETSWKHKAINKGFIKHLNRLFCFIAYGSLSLYPPSLSTALRARVFVNILLVKYIDPRWCNLTDISVTSSVCVRACDSLCLGQVHSLLVRVYKSLSVTNCYITELHQVLLSSFMHYITECTVAAFMKVAAIKWN